MIRMRYALLVGLVAGGIWIASGVTFYLFGGCG